jgi:hypothetical protein
MMSVTPPAHPRALRGTLYFCFTPQQNHQSLADDTAKIACS